MPKSSMAIRIRSPRSRRSWRIASLSVLVATRLLSVTSITSASPGSPACRSAVSTWSAKSGSSSWRPDTFTATATPCVAVPGEASRQACFSTQAPIGTISPVSSAIGMNSAGGTGGASGGSQRSSASTAIDRPVSQVHHRLVVQVELARVERRRSSLCRRLRCIRAARSARLELGSPVAAAPPWPRTGRGRRRAARPTGWPASPGRR